MTSWDEQRAKKLWNELGLHNFNDEIEAVTVALRDAEKRGRTRYEVAEISLAGLADCINQELRENGPVGVVQIDQITEDMRSFVRTLVDMVRSKTLASIAREMGRR